MADFKLFRIEDNEITETAKLTPRDLILVSDASDKAIYVYKPSTHAIYDEFESQELYNLILNKFLNPNIHLIKDLRQSASDPEKIKEIKAYIRSFLPNPFFSRLSLFVQNLFGLKRMRENISLFKNYQQSSAWRRRLSNQTGLWRLSIFNSVASLIIAVFAALVIVLSIRPLYTGGGLADGMLVWLQNLSIYQFILILCASGIFIVNLAFVLFPLRFPIKPQAMEKMK